MDQTTEQVAQPDVQTTTTLTSDQTTTEQPKEVDFKSLIPEAYQILLGLLKNYLQFSFSLLM